MTHSYADDALHVTIGNVIRSRLGAGHIVDVIVDRDEEFDDEAVLLVTVVIDHADAELNEDHVLGLVRYLQPALADIGETAFPLISFLTEQERREAA